MGRIDWLAGLAVLVGSAGLWAQGIQVRLNVEVTDKAGHPIPGLQQSDFKVLDNGKPAPAATFGAHEDGATNPGAEWIVLVVDNVNVDVHLVMSERKPIETFLRSRNGHLPAPVSILLLNDAGEQQIGDSTLDGNHLADQWERSEIHLQPVPPLSMQGQQERWQQSMDLLNQILSAEEDKPGRKLVVWISPGWSTFNSTDLEVEDSMRHRWMEGIVRLSSKIRESGVTLDVADPVGQGYGMYASDWQAFLKPVKKWDHAALGDFALEVLAKQSGGQVLYSGNDLAGELEQCTGDAAAWYTLAFAAAPGQKKEVTWHDVQVEVDKPGAVVRTADGYYAEP